MVGARWYGTEKTELLHPDEVQARMPPAGYHRWRECQGMQAAQNPRESRGVARQQEVWRTSHLAIPSDAAHRFVCWSLCSAAAAVGEKASECEGGEYES